MLIFILGIDKVAGRKAIGIREPSVWLGDWAS